MIATKYGEEEKGWLPGRVLTFEVLWGYVLGRQVVVNRGLWSLSTMCQFRCLSPSLY